MLTTVTLKVTRQISLTTIDISCERVRILTGLAWLQPTTHSGAWSKDFDGRRGAERRRDGRREGGCRVCSRREEGPCREGPGGTRTLRAPVRQARHGDTAASGAGRENSGAPAMFIGETEESHCSC